MSPRALTAARDHWRAGRVAEAEAAYRAALRDDPDSEECVCGLAAIIATNRTRLAEAEAVLREGAARMPDSVVVRGRLAALVGMRSRHGEAAAMLREVVKAAPSDVVAWGNLGTALEHCQRPDEAIEAYQTAIGIQPGIAVVHRNLGNALRTVGRWRQAEKSFRQALRLDPSLVEAWSSLGAMLANSGRNEEAVGCHRRAAELRPESAPAASDFLYALHYVEQSPAALLAEHRRWAQRVEGARHGRHPNNPDPDRRLRVGYVSPNMNEHPTGRYLAPLQAHHDSTQVEVFSYSDSPSNDSVALALRSRSHAWRETAGWTDDQLAEQVGRDGIDILVDLALHMAKNRLRVFAMRPAPVQVSWLGYPSTTGLDAIDYRLTDPFMDTPTVVGDPTRIEEEAMYAEQSYCLPMCSVCYVAPKPSPGVNALPAVTTGGVTFGSFNNFAKVGRSLLSFWARLLCQIPDSRLVLFCDRGDYREDVVQVFAHAGVAPARISFIHRQQRYQHLLEHHRVDIALDSFPYGGTTTSCDAMWMGVPTVTVRGTTGVGRGAVSTLSNAGLAEWVAYTGDQYIAIATQMAADLPALARLRATLRERMRTSALMDAPRFAKDIEAAYRWMWRRWCEDPNRQSAGLF